MPSFQKFQINESQIIKKTNIIMLTRMGRNVYHMLLILFIKWKTTLDSNICVILVSRSWIYFAWISVRLLSIILQIENKIRNK